MLAAAFVDLVCFAPSVAMQGPAPAELLAGSRAGLAISPESLAAVVTRWRLLHRALAPASAARIAEQSASSGHWAELPAAG